MIDCLFSVIIPKKVGGYMTDKTVSIIKIVLLLKMAELIEGSDLHKELQVALKELEEYSKNKKGR